MKHSKILFTTLAVALLTACNTDGKKAEAASADEAKQETKADASVDVLTDDLGSVDSVYYDAEGRVVRISQTGNDVYGEKKNAIVDEMTYSQYGKLIRILHHENRNSGYPLVSEYLFTYTREGRLCTSLFRTVGQKKNEASKTVLSYNGKGQLLNIVNGKAKSVFEYDKAGNLVAQKHTDKDDNDELIKNEAWTYTYDEGGHCTESHAVITKNVGLLNEDTVHYVYQFSYDKVGRCVKEVNCGDVTINYNYDNRGRQVNFVLSVSDHPTATVINSAAKEPRSLLYRQRGTSDLRSPFTIDLAAISLTLEWFNGGI